jgi:hypothetical protein
MEQNTNLLNSKLLKHKSVLGAEMARAEINIIALTDNYVLYEFSYIGENKMKKWAKRLAPLKGGIASTYEYLIKSVEREREAMGQ